MGQTPNDKLEQFEQAILQKAAAERQEILKAAQEQKSAELDKEENRLLEELYRKIQAEITQIKQDSIREVSAETLSVKKKLHQQREQYLIEMLANARVKLDAFVKSDDYAAFLLDKAQRLADEYRFEDSTILLRGDDLIYADRIKETYGECHIRADEQITIGGMILENHARGIEVDLSLDTALAEQRDWFYHHSGMNIE